MAISKTFLLNGINPAQVEARVEEFLRSEKGMEVQSAQTSEGFVLQASQPKDGWKTITGMRLAITVQMVAMGDQLNVNIGEGQWSDKIGAGALGWFLAWPLAVTAGIGAYKQKKLPEEIMHMIEGYLLAGGKRVEMNQTGPIVKEGMMVCPKCKGQIAAGSKFCNLCGEKIAQICPQCGAPLTAGSKFCGQCGKEV